ncbi:hypothetical protein PanWU01x14_277590, partial [Parasponia andersonii]
LLGSVNIRPFENSSSCESTCESWDAVRAYMFLEDWSSFVFLISTSVRALFSSSIAHNCSVSMLIFLLGVSEELSPMESNNKLVGFDFLLISIESLPSISTSLFIFAKAAGPGNRFRTSRRSL